ncbi:hypothetical protein MTR67_002880, partial [Solanum verrucosum]
FEWFEECELSFLKLKKLSTITSILTPPVKGEGFMVNFNASSIGSGCVLMQRDSLIAYMLRQLGYMSTTTTQMTWSWQRMP